MRRLDISLKAGNVDDADIPLHLSVRFDEDAIVRNTRLAGAWGDEERDENRHPFTVACPLVAGDRFKVYIFVGDSRFHIAINDAAFCTYAFRTPVQHILAVDVQHDLQTITQMDQRATFPAPLPLVQMGDGGDDGSGGRMEFSNDVPRRFSAGSSTKMLCSLNISWTLTISMSRSCGGDHGHTVRQCTRHVSGALHGRRVAETGAAFQCAL